MTSIRKSVIAGGNSHYVQVDSSLDLEEVEITGTDPISGKVVHVSLSSLLKQPKQPEPSPVSPQPLQMFDTPQEGWPAQAGAGGTKDEPASSDKVIHDLFD